MQKPEVQQQMQQMQAAMQNQELQDKLASLREDPEFKDMFEDIQKNGMAAMMKYYNDPQWIAKLGRKMGDVNIAEDAAAAATPAAPPAPEDLIDAARWRCFHLAALLACSLSPLPGYFASRDAEVVNY